MAAYFSSAPFMSYPLARTTHLSSSPQSPPSELSITTTSEQQPTVSVKVQPKPPQPEAATTTLQTTDRKASSMSRRFGLGAGLSLAAFLAVGVITDPFKTRQEQEANAREVEKQEEVEVVLPNGIRYYELRVGGGAFASDGDMVVIDVKGRIEDSSGGDGGGDQVFVDTFGGDEKAAVAVVGNGRMVRPYSCKGMCEGVEYVTRSMKAGGKRRIIVPPNLGFGERGADLGSGQLIPPSAPHEYIVEVHNVSFSPAAW